MRGSHRIYIVALKSLNIPKHLFHADHTTAGCGELVTVHAFENYSFSVKEHDFVFELEGSEADFCGCVLSHFSRSVTQKKAALIQVGYLSAPVSHRKTLHVKADLVTLNRHGRFENLLFTVIVKFKDGRLGIAHNIGFYVQNALVIRSIQSGLNEHVTHMNRGNRIEEHIPEDTEKPPHILVFQP